MSSRHLALTLLARYLFFLQRRPISASNVHYLGRRLAGLKSLAAVLEGDGDPGVRTAARRALRLTPANLDRLAPEVISGLLQSVLRRPPEDFLVSRRPPDASFLGDARRVLLILGPGVGVGDEIMCFPLPSWMGGSEDRRVTVLSAYRDLWARVQGVERVVFYRRHAELVEALSGKGSWADFDLVALIDFESPDLAPSVCRQDSNRAFLEVGLGERAVTAVDMARRRVHRMPDPEPYCANFYHALEHAGRWLGLSTSAEARTGRVAPSGRRADERIVVVCPFSSKYDPSGLFWGRLLAAVLAEPLAPRARVLIDPGPNRETEGFARALARSVPIRQGSGLSCEIVTSVEGRSVSLGRMMEVFDHAHVVITADSYAAHAAPVFGCTTLVLASEKLENWRVPGSPAFYFEGERPLDEIVAAMRSVLAATGVASTGALDVDPRRTKPGRLLDAETERLGSCFAAGASSAELLAAQESWSTAYRAFLSTRRDWPLAAGSLFEDVPYERFLAPPPALEEGAAAAGLEPSLELHLRDRFEGWSNTNLRKFLALPPAEESV